MESIHHYLEDQSTPKKMKICFDYEDFEEFRRDITVCWGILRDDFGEYFAEYYSPNGVQRVG